MDNPRPEKVAVVDEVRSRLEDAAASVVTEYRGLTVKEIAQLRRSLTAAGGDYKVFKNTLVRRAIDGSAYAPLEEFLTGPTAIAFVHGDVSAVAKVLRDFSRTNAHLVVKGGLLDGSVLGPGQLGSLADLPSREVLLAQMAAAVQAPLAQLAGLMQAFTRNLAYGLKALVDERGGPVDAGESPAGESPAGESPAGDVAPAGDDAPAGDVSAETPTEPPPSVESPGEPTQGEAASVESAPVESAPVESAPVESAPAADVSAETRPEAQAEGGA